MLLVFWGQQPAGEGWCTPAKIFLSTVSHSGNGCGPGPSARSLSFRIVILGTFGLNEVRDDYF